MLTDSNFTFSDLPLEMIFEICRHLDIYSLFKFLAANKGIRTTIAEDYVLWQQLTETHFPKNLHFAPSNRGEFSLKTFSKQWQATYFRPTERQKHLPLIIAVKERDEKSAIEYIQANRAEHFKFASDFYNFTCYLNEQKSLPFSYMLLAYHLSDVLNFIGENYADDTLIDNTNESINAMVESKPVTEITSIFSSLTEEQRRAVIPFACSLHALYIIQGLKNADASYDSFFNRYVREGELIYWAITYSSAAIVTELIKIDGYNINQAAEKTGQTPLLAACRDGTIEMVEAMLTHAAEVNVRDSLGWTPLMVACRYGTTEMVQALLKAGAEVNVESQDHSTPLLLACRYGTVDMVKALVEHGAEIHANALPYALVSKNRATCNYLLELSPENVAPTKSMNC